VYAHKDVHNGIYLVLQFFKDIITSQIIWQQLKYTSIKQKVASMLALLQVLVWMWSLCWQRRFLNIHAIRGKFMVPNSDLLSWDLGYSDNLLAFGWSELFLS
jgi:hypothetical protein